MDHSASGHASLSSSTDASPDMNGTNRPHPPPGGVASRDTSQYQLVFGIDDTSSEASFTDSPLLHDRALHTQQDNDPGDPPQSRDPPQNEGSSIAKVSHTGGGLCTAVSMPVSAVGVDSADSAPVRGEVAGTGAGVPDVSTTNEMLLDSTHKPLNGFSSSPKNSLGQERNKSDSGAGLPVQGRARSQSQSPEAELKLDDIPLRSRSASLEDGPKAHPLSFLTSDSELGETPTPPPQAAYSPIPNTSGDEDQVSPSSPSSLLPFSPSSDEDAPIMSVLFNGVTYLGSSSVDAPISEIEANRKMHILREQSEGTEPIPIVLSVPLTNHGSVILKDPRSDQAMATHPIKQILFCARGNAEVLLDCFCLNVKNRRSGLYQCHVFRCEVLDACDRIFKAIGKAFTTKTVDKNLPPLTGDHISRDFLVTVDIHEEDGKGSFSPVHMDRDCFKLRQNTRKKLTICVSQPQSSDRALVVTRCFGLLMSPGKDVKMTDMDLLDNMNPSPSPGPSFSVSGIWDVNVPFLASLNEETPKSMRFQYLTVAADLILESVTEPVRFRREVKVHISKGGMSYTILKELSKKKQGPMDLKYYTLQLKKSPDSSHQQSVYMVDQLRPASELRQAAPAEVSRVNSEDHTPSPTQLQKSKRSEKRRLKSTDEQEDSDNGGENGENEGEDDMVVSGWGDPGVRMREDLLKEWGDIFERWDGKERGRPSKVTKLCRKGIPRHLRCQVWQMLTGAAHDPQLAEAYRLLLSKESPAENVINWDIKRTYVGHGYFQEPGNREALYKISKAYSVYDEEVGYCQGFSFMAAVLLLQKMPEETAFSVLVKIMYNYGHRNLFKANFGDLHLMFYQLDRLLEEFLPDLYQHMQANRIETHMFASQWFLTLYTAKFPLSIVFRILDIYLCERIGSIFQVALSLLKISRKELLALDFEGILGFFRVSLPKKFQSEEDCQLLFDTMFTFKVNEKKLSKLQKDYQSYLEQQAQLEDPVMRLERDNKALRDTIHRLEQENDNLAQDLVSSKIKLRFDMDKLEERIDSLSKEARSYKNSHEAAVLTVNQLREELKQAKEEFQNVMMTLSEERQQHQVATTEYRQLFEKMDANAQKQEEKMSQELFAVKAKLGSNSDLAPPDSAGSPQTTSEMRLRNLELELAQTKLALVESQCKNQELEHRVAELTSMKSKKWYDDFVVHKKK